MMMQTRGRPAPCRQVLTAILVLGVALAAPPRPASAQPGLPNIPVWSYPGAWHPGVGRDTIEARPRTLTVRWLRDPAAEARPDFGGYRIYRGTNLGGICDTSSMVLMRRFSRQISDSLFTWHFPAIAANTPESQRVATFIDPDSAGRFVKVRRPLDDPCRHIQPTCPDSILALIPPPGPHDGFRTWYSITYEALNTSFNDYLDLFVPGPMEVRRDVSVDRGPVAVAAGDVTGDGLADLVTANQTANTVSIRPGRRAESCQFADFGPRRDLPTGAAPRAVAIGDVNQDEIGDIVVANGGAKTVTVYLGNAQGAPIPAPDVPLNGTPTAIVLGDIDGDGVLDMAVTNADGPSVSVWRGNADGTFTPGTEVPTALAAPSALALSDLNLDRHPDLVLVSPAGGTVAWRLGDGNGGFGPESMTPAGLGARALVVDDINGDNKADVIVANGLGNDVAVLRGNGDGTFGVASHYPAGAGPSSLAILDLDSDGRPDIAAANAEDGSLSILFNDGFGFPTRTNTLLLGRPVSLVAADFSHEGLPDLGVADSSADSAKVLFGPSNLNHKAANVSNDVANPTADPGAPADDRYFAHAVAPTGGPAANLARVAVVPNPYRAVEAWNPVGSQEIHFINLPSQARIRIYTLAGDLVRDLRHAIDAAAATTTPWDQSRDFEAWDLKNDAGRDVGSGVYIYRVESGALFHQSRFVVIR